MSLPNNDCRKHCPESNKTDYCQHCLNSHREPTPVQKLKHNLGVDCAFVDPDVGMFVQLDDQQKIDVLCAMRSTIKELQDSVSYLSATSDAVCYSKPEIQAPIDHGRIVEMLPPAPISSLLIAVFMFIGSVVCLLAVAVAQNPKMLQVMSDFCSAI